MRSITFSFRPNLPHEDQEQALERINAQSFIHKAARLHPDVKHPVLSQIGYAYVDDQADLDEAVRSLSEIPGIESVSIPAQRRLA